MRAVAILSLFFLCACGQAGPLYLPDQKPAQQESARPPVPAAQQDQPKKEQK